MSDKASHDARREGSEASEESEEKTARLVFENQWLFFMTFTPFTIFMSSSCTYLIVTTAAAARPFTSGAYICSANVPATLKTPAVVARTM